VQQTQYTGYACIAAVCASCRVPGALYSQLRAAVAQRYQGVVDRGEAKRQQKKQKHSKKHLVNTVS
jgi:hypothetical protein